MSEGTKRDETKKGVPVQDTDTTQTSSPTEASGEINNNDGPPSPEEVSNTTVPPVEESTDEPKPARIADNDTEDNFYQERRGETLDGGGTWVPPEEAHSKPKTALWVVLALLVAGILAFTGIYLGSRGQDLARSAQEQAKKADMSAFSAELKAKKAEEAVGAAASSAKEAKKTADGLEGKINEAVNTANTAKKTADGLEMKISEAVKKADDARDMARKAASKADEAAATAQSNLKRLDERKECLERVCDQAKARKIARKKPRRRKWKTPRKWRKAKKRRRAATNRPNRRLEKRVSRLWRDMYKPGGKVPRLEREVDQIKRDLDQVNEAQAAYQRHLSALREEFRGFRDSKPSQ
jgi:chemotaxis protein histidine kinase CheA